VERAELGGQRLSQLRQIADDRGIVQQLTDKALDSSNPHGALIDLVVHDTEVKLLSTANANGYTPAHCAAKNGHVAVLCFLVERGAHETFYAKDEHGNTPFHFAARLQDASCLTCLANKCGQNDGRAAMEVVNSCGWTLAHFAANSGSLACLQLLAQFWSEAGLFVCKTHTMDGQACDVDGGTLPHHWAARAGHCECLQFLVEHSSSCDQVEQIVNQAGDTPAQWVLVHNDRSKWSATQQLSRGVQTYVRSLPWDLRWTRAPRVEPVRSAQKVQMLKIIHAWIPYSVGLENNKGRTLGHLMAEQGELEGLRLLVSLGFPGLLEKQDGKGLTPAHWAISTLRRTILHYGTSQSIETCFNCLKTLVELGAGASFCVGELAKGRCPGHWMMRDYNWESFSAEMVERELRLLHRANPDALVTRDESGQTPVHRIRGHFRQVVALLAELGCGATLSQRDQRGKTPAHAIARTMRFSAQAETLKGVSAVWRQLHHSGHGDSLSWKDEDGRTPFLLAVQNGGTDEADWSQVIELMGEIAPQSLLAVDNYGRSAAHYAAQQSRRFICHRHFLEQLAKHGAASSFYAKDNDGITPGAYAAFLAECECLTALHAGLANIIDPALQALRLLEQAGGPTITNAIRELELDRNFSRDLGYVEWKDAYQKSRHNCHYEVDNYDGSGTSVPDICAHGFPSIDLQDDLPHDSDGLKSEMDCLALLQRVGALDHLVATVTPGDLDRKYVRLLLDPSLLPLEKKQRWLHYRLEGRMQNTNAQTLSLTSVRDDILQGMCVQLGVDETTGQIAAHTAAQALDVQFQDENGAGDGVRREWFDLVVAEMIDPDHGLFLSKDGGRTLQPNPHSELSGGADHLSYFALLGRITGFAIYHEAHLNVHWTKAFIKAAFGLAVTADDLECVDPELFKSRIVYLRESQYLKHEMTLDDLELTFEDDSNQEEYSVIGASKELKEGGGAISVTEENKAEYLQLFAEHRLLHAIRPQVQAFRDGLAVILDDNTQTILRKCCTSAELQLLVCGMPNIDVIDWRAHTEYSGFAATDDVVAWFWSLVDEMPTAERAKLLAFSTGSARVPATGFANLMGYNGARTRFKIERLDGSAQRLPVAQTCFNTLKLAAYPSKRMLEEKLLVAMQESGGFDEAVAAGH
jgi:E3 ubiquitin-protein ligase HACE1